MIGVDDRPISDLPEFIAALYLHGSDEIVKIDILRGTGAMSFKVPVTIHHDSMDELSDMPDVPKNLIWQLSVFATDLNEKIKSLVHADDSDSGIVVIAQAGGPRTVDTGLQPGDVIAIGHRPVHSVSQLQDVLGTIKSGGPSRSPNRTRRQVSIPRIRNGLIFKQA